MAGRPTDPYETLGLSSTASDAEVRAAYRRLVQLHHPDHNGGSAASTRRFEEIQDAYAQVRERRGATGRGDAPRNTAGPNTAGRNTAGRNASGARQSPPPRGQTPPRTAQTPPRAGRAAGAGADAASDSRMADLEREIREAHLARERARQAAREAAAEAASRPSDEDLGYVKTDDSLAKIFADARAQAAERFGEVKEPVARRVADLLDDLASKLNGDGRSRPRD